MFHTIFFYAIISGGKKLPMNGIMKVLIQVNQESLMKRS